MLKLLIGRECIVVVVTVVSGYVFCMLCIDTDFYGKNALTVWYELLSRACIVQSFLKSDNPFFALCTLCGPVALRRCVVALFMSLCCVMLYCTVVLCRCIISLYCVAVLCSFVVLRRCIKS